MQRVSFVSFILVADGGRYQGLKRALYNQYLMDRDAYPTTMPQVLKLLETFKPDSTADVAPNDTGGAAGAGSGVGAGAATSTCCPATAAFTNPFLVFLCGWLLNASQNFF